MSFLLSGVTIQMLMNNKISLRNTYDVHLSKYLDNIVSPK